MHRRATALPHYVAALVALLVPLAACSMLTLCRTQVPPVDDALILLTVTVSVAAVTVWAAGATAAVSTALWFDLLLTKPYEHLSIASPSNQVTAVLLGVAGLASTAVLEWRRRHHYQRGRHAGYLTGIVAVSDVLPGDSPTQLTRQVAGQLTEILQLENCRFEFGAGANSPRLQRDGALTWASHRWDVERRGLPRKEATELLVSPTDTARGRFLMTPTPGSRPSLTERLVAVSLASQLGTALGDWDDDRAPEE